MRKSVFFLVAVLCLNSFNYAASDISQVKISPSDGVAKDNFGSSVAISGTQCVVGAFNGSNSNHDGAAYVFGYQTTWTESKKFFDDSDFGSCVAVDNRTIVVGAPGFDDYSASPPVIKQGTVYVYTHNGSDWASAYLVASDPYEGDKFGSAVAIDGDRIVVGVPLKQEVLGTVPIVFGAVYVFKYDGSNWTQESKLTSEQNTEADHFGHSVAIDGDTIVVGAYREDSVAGEAGAAYVFDYANGAWTKTAKLTASDGAAYDSFAWDVDISGDWIVVGAYGNDGVGEGAGAAYVYQKSNGSWSQFAKLTASDPNTNDEFGYAVAIDTDKIVVGAPKDDDSGLESGTAFLFSYASGSWTQSAKLAADDALTGARFGVAVDIDSDNAIVGAKNDYNGKPGNAYIFDLDDVPTPADVKVTLGSKFTLTAANIEDLGDVFYTKPKVTGGDFIDPYKNKTGKATAKVLTKVKKGLDSNTGEIADKVDCEWKTKIVLYDKKVVKRALKSGKTMTEALTGNQTSSLETSLTVICKKENKDKFSGDAGKATLQIPTISSVTYDGDLTENTQLTIKGAYFGNKAPSASIEYIHKGKIKYKKCKLLKSSYKYADASGKPNKSVMNVETGESEILVLYPKLKPDSQTTGYLVIDNKIGIATYSFPSK